MLRRSHLTPRSRTRLMSSYEVDRVLARRLIMSDPSDPVDSPQHM